MVVDYIIPGVKDWWRQQIPRQMVSFISCIEDKNFVEKSVYNFELTFSSLLAGGCLLPGTCRVCHIEYMISYLFLVFRT